MTREIKFRAWDKTINKMLFPMEFQNNIGVSIPNEYLSCDDTDIFLRCRFETQLMQYTGFKDKNSIEIYEGDILRVIYDGIEDDDDIISVTYTNTESEVYNYEYVGWTFPVDGVELEIIGNIYENKELCNE